MSEAYDEMYAAAEWKVTRDAAHTKILNKSSNMTRKTFAICGDRVCVTHNIIGRRGKVIPNGAQGTVTAIDAKHCAVTVDIEKPFAMSNVRFTRCKSNYKKGVGVACVRQ